MNRELADQLKDRVYKNFDDDGIEDITEDIIIEAIEDLRLMKRFADITDEEVQVVINTIFYERGVQVDDIGESKYLKDGDNWSTWIRGDIKSKTEDFYFNRYKKYLLEYKNLPNKSVVQLEQDVMNIVDLVGNPNVDGDFTRRGLIIGEVQSGKTSNFLGVLNKCADYGYQIIVVLTSNNESLRKQTQIRLDEGFIGVKHLGAKRIKLGVGKIKHADDKSPYTLTSDKTDFKTKLANEKNITPGQLASGTPIVIVAKKNITTLNNIKEWFERNGFSKSSGIDFPMLLIDDEADNASINVSGNVEKPTAINDIIRDLLSSFKKNSYVGYTATPYANIFINQNNGDEREDLFPKDYIFVLNTPSQYVGVSELFHYDMDMKDNEYINSNDDLVEVMQLNHKKDFELDYLPETLEDALYTFFITNALLDCRYISLKHRSMLIHITRFADVPKSIKSLVLQFKAEVKDSLLIHGKKSIEKALAEPHIFNLKRVYEEQFPNETIEFIELLRSMIKNIHKIDVRIVNSKSKDIGLNYDSSKDGLRVIAIGGLSLARGLTLEGLTTSYFYRGTNTYDTLLQMGRWFGYRNGYKDLCRLWIPGFSYNYFQKICLANEELAIDLVNMYSEGKKPKDFSIRIRNDLNSLEIAARNIKQEEKNIQITAKNKMRNSISYDVLCSLSGEFVETPKIYVNRDINNYNLKLMHDMIFDINESGINCEYKEHKESDKLLYRNVERGIITKLIGKFNSPKRNNNFQSENLVKFIENDYDGKELEKWDVLITHGSRNPYQIEEGIYTAIADRSCHLIDNDSIIQVSCERNRLGGPSDMKPVLSKEQLEQVYKIVEENNKILKSNGKKEKKNPSTKDYLKVTKNPILIVYLIYPDIGNKEHHIYNEGRDFDKEPLIGISIGIPKLRNEETKYVRYYANLVINAEDDGDDDDY